MKTGIEEVERLVIDVEGHISNLEGECLYHLATSSKTKGVMLLILTGDPRIGMAKVTRSYSATIFKKLGLTTSLFLWL